MAPVDEWLGPGLYKALGQYLEGELGVEEVDDMRMLEPEQLQVARGMLKPVPLKKFNLKYEELMGYSTTHSSTLAVSEAVPPEPRDVHSAATRWSASTDGAEPEPWSDSSPMIVPSSIKDFLSVYCIFGSMRFPVPEEARLLFDALRMAAGVHLKIVDMSAGQDIDKEVYEWIEHCSAFLVMGTKHYGEDTGNSACTYREVKFAQAKKKKIILLRMIPWDEEFDHLQARVLFSQNILTLEWQRNEDGSASSMPASLVPEIIKAMQLPADGPGGATPGHAEVVAHARTVKAEAEAVKIHAQVQVQEAQAAAAAAQEAKVEEATARAVAEAARVRAEEDTARAKAEAARARAEAEEIRGREQAVREQAAAREDAVRKQAARDVELERAREKAAAPTSQFRLPGLAREQASARRAQEACTDPNQGRIAELQAQLDHVIQEADRLFDANRLGQMEEQLQIAETLRQNIDSLQRGTRETEAAEPEPEPKPGMPSEFPSPAHAPAPWARQTFAPAMATWAPRDIGVTGGGGGASSAAAHPRTPTDTSSAQKAQAQVQTLGLAGLVLTAAAHYWWCGVYSHEGVQDDGWPYFREVRGRAFLFHKDAGGDSMWYIHKRHVAYKDPTILKETTRLKSELVPVGTHKWTGWDARTHYKRQSEMEFTLEPARYVQY